MSENGIVGVWTYQHYTGAAAYERYTAQGELQFRLVLSAHPGCYSASGGTLTMTQPKASTTPYVLDGDRLTITAEGKRPFIYRRVPGGPWYPRDPLVGSERK